MFVFVYGSGSSCAASQSSTLPLAPFPSLVAMADGGAFAIEVAAGIASEGHIVSLEAELKAITEARKTKSKQVKKERQKRDRLMAKAGKNLSVEDLSQLLAVQTAKAAAKAKAKAKAKPKAAPKAAPAPLGGGEEALGL